VQEIENSSHNQQDIDAKFGGVRQKMMKINAPIWASLHALCHAQAAVVSVGRSKFCVISFVLRLP